MQFDLKVIFVDGSYIIIQNVTNFSLYYERKTYEIIISDSNVKTFINSDQVRAIGRKEDLENIMF